VWGGSEHRITSVGASASLLSVSIWRSLGLSEVVTLGSEGELEEGLSATDTTEFLLSAVYGVLKSSRERLTIFIE
jgi:hypothetical protein